MFLPASWFTLFLALSITGSPVEVRNSSITLPLTRRLNFSNGTINFLQHDKARVAAFRGYNTHGRRTDSIPVLNSFFDYTVAVGVGRPRTVYDLIVDTGSSVTWVGASTPYVKTDTSVNTRRHVAEGYGCDENDNPESSFSGTIFLDTVTLGDGLTVTEFPLGVASEWMGFNQGEDGVLGIGPEDLTEGTLTYQRTRIFPTFTDYLYNQGKIGQHVVGIFFQPVTTSPDSHFGELTFGGPDYTKFTGNIACTPITAIDPSSNYWGIDQSITYGPTTILLHTDGIVDSGTTFLQLASNAFERYQAVTGAALDQGTKLLRISPDQYSALRSLDFHIGGKIFSLTPNAQIWPRSFNLKLDVPGDPNAIYLIVTDIGKRSGQGLDFILGYTFIQRFYTIFDGSNSCVGFAITKFTDVTTN